MQKMCWSGFLRVKICSFSLFIWMLTEPFLKIISGQPVTLNMQSEDITLSFGTQKIKHTDKREWNLTWGSNVGRLAFWPFPNRGGVARRQVWSASPLHPPLEWRGSWLGGRQGRNGRGRDEEWGSRTRLHPNWPGEKQSRLTTAVTRKGLDGNQSEIQD